VLQKINVEVFKNVEVITKNIFEVAKHLENKNYPHKILKPLTFVNGDFLYENKWRIFEFFENTKTYEKAISTHQAFEAAKFLGEFHIYLKDFDLNKITQPISGFLDFNLRLKQFEKSLKTASSARKTKAKQEIKILQKNIFLLEKWNLINEKLPQRLIHADPKISNFLFSEENSQQIIALIDWDTLMKGSILYDFGDMIRSYTNLKSEDDFSKENNFSLENYQNIKKGFLYHLAEELTEREKENMTLEEKVVIYVKALRFLTDFLNNDIYFSVKRENQNLQRTKSQLNLLENLNKEIK